MVPSQTIGAVAINKREFNARISDWFNRKEIMGSSKDTTCFNSAPICSAKYDPQYCASSKGSTKSSRSSRSFSLTAKRFQATLNLKSEQLHANHKRERVEEHQRKSQLEIELQQRKSPLEMELQQKEALHKIALAELECKAWKYAENNQYRGTSISNLNPLTLLHPLKNFKTSF